jgi:GTPase SAR1 family protein
VEAGIQVENKRTSIDGRKTNIQFWIGRDDSGINYYRESHGALFVFDVTSQSSFSELSHLYGSFLEKAGVEYKTDFPLVLIGNKADMSENRQITFE